MTDVSQKIVLVEDWSFQGTISQELELMLVCKLVCLWNCTNIMQDVMPTAKPTNLCVLL